MNKKNWFNWFDRVRFTYIVACAALFLGAVYPWYKIPPLAMETFGIGDLPILIVAKILASFLTGLVFYFIWQQRRFRGNRKVLRIILWIGLIMALLFPYAIMTWHPRIALIASSSYVQQFQITMDIEQKFSEVQAQWKRGYTLTRSFIPDSTFGLSISDTTFFQLPSWYLILSDGLRYSISFFTLVAHGWSMTIIGSSIALLAMYLSIIKNRFEILFKDLSLVIPWSGLIIISILISLLGLNITNYQLDVLFAKGEYQKVLEISQNIEAWYPSLKGDAYFLSRKGKASFYAKFPNQSLINFVIGLSYLDLKDFLNSELYFQKALDLQPDQFLIRAYLTNSINNQGVDDFNIQKTSSAIQHFEESLKVMPSNLETLYNLMIATTVNGDFDKSAAIAKLIIDNQKYFQLPSLSILGQAYVHLTWNDFHDGDLNKAWNQYRKSIDPKAWGKL